MRFGLFREIRSEVIFDLKKSEIVHSLLHSESRQVYQNFNTKWEDDAIADAAVLQ